MGMLVPPLPAPPRHDGVMGIMPEERTCANCVNHRTAEDARMYLAADLEVHNMMYEAEKDRERKEWRQIGCMAIFAFILLAVIIVAALTGAIVL